MRFDLTGSLLSSLPPYLSGILLGLGWGAMTGTDAISSGMASASIVRRFFCFGTGFVFSLSKCSIRPLDSNMVRNQIELT